MDRNSLKISVICFVVAILAGGIYFNSLGNQFTNWDDGMIYANSTIRNLTWGGIKTLFTYTKANTYQPVRMLSYALDYRFWKLNPVGYHITNIFFYILTCIMVFLTLRLLSMRLREGNGEGSHLRVALFGSLLFAAHPVHVEAVAWLAARKEVLQGCFFFLAFFLYLEGREKGSQKRFLYFGLALCSILLAVLSKPSAIVFPAVLVIYEIASRRDRWIGVLRTNWPFFTVSIVISVVFASILLKVMLDAGGIKPYRGGDFLSNILMSFHALIHSINLLFVTINYSAAYTIPISNSLFNLRTFSFVGTSLILLGAGFWSLKRRRVVFFSIFFFLITMLPYLNLIPISTLLADRYVFIASFSYVFLLGVIFDRLYLFRRKGFSEGFFKLLSAALFCFVLTGYSLMTIHQNKIWENSYTLWSDAVEKSPESNTANAMMGVVFMELGMDQEAAIHLEKAVQLLPYDYESLNNLGIVYGRQNQPEKALKNLMTAMWLNPDSDSVKINLSLYYQKQKEYKKSEEILRYLTAKNPNHAQLFYRLAMLYKEAGDSEGAIRELNRCQELAPHIINSYEELGNIYLSRLKNVEKAKVFYLKGIENVPKAGARIEQLRWMIQDLER